MTQGISPVVIVLLGLLALVLILLGIAVVRALKLPRKKAEYRAPASDTRAEQYAEKLSRMVAFDTVSIPETNQRNKFLPFHALLEELFADETCKDIRFVKGHKDTYYYSDELMANNYAKIAMLTLEKDDARTVAEMVRFNCKAFPTPTPLYYFARQPFFLKKETMDALIAQMKNDPEYQDIREVIADVNGEKYLYSIDLMSEKYARALANGAESREADE
jgi:Na+-transporting methylmalonyl-CoA/oxaloacetate decarboxylase gamma subunit